MATTPEVLQKRFAMPAELGTVDVPRGIHAFIGERASDRRTALEVYYPAVMSGALVGEGQHRRAVKSITQHEMARRAGVTRVTMTRRISKLARSAAGYETAADRRRHAEKLLARATKVLHDHKESCKACTAGTACERAELLALRIGQVHEEAKYQRKHVPLFNRRRRFAMPNRYSLATVERTEIWAILETSTSTEIKRFFDVSKATAACDRLIRKGIETGSCTEYQVEAVKMNGKSHHFAELEQLTADAITGAWWDRDFKSHGFKSDSRWVWDARILDPDTGKPLGSMARLVMTAYEEMGLLEEFRDPKTGKVSKAKGVLPVRQRTVARYLGISVKSVYAANGKWERLGVLRIVSGEPKLTESGYKRGPQKVLYLPFRMLTEAEAVQEEQRMATAVRQIVAREGSQRVAQLVESQRIHGELLAAWRGREHCLGAFWRELARRLDAALIFPDLISKLVPPGRPEPERS